MKTGNRKPETRNAFRGRAAFWFLLSAFWFASCHRESPVPPTQTAPPVTETHAAPAPPPTRKLVRSTPQQCAGDGSYEQALDCLRIAAQLRFNVDAAAFSGEGTVTRQTVGAERVELSLKDGQWIAEPKLAGIVWTHDGKKATPSPDLERLYQRLTVVLDPQKKEGTPQLTGIEPLAGTNANHFHFTDANSGEAYDVWISVADGHIVQERIGQLFLTFR